MGAANRAKRVGGNRRLKIGRNPSTSASTPPFANERVSNRIELLPPFEVGRAKSVSPIGPMANSINDFARVSSVSTNYRPILQRIRYSDGIFAPYLIRV